MGFIDKPAEVVEVHQRSSLSLIKYFFRIPLEKSQMSAKKESKKIVGGANSSQIQNQVREVAFITWSSLIKTTSGGQKKRFAFP